MNINTQSTESSPTSTERLQDLRRRASLAFGDHGNLPAPPTAHSAN